MHIFAARRFIFSVIAAAAAFAPGPASAKVKVGEIAPVFTLTTVDGHKILSEQLRGKVVVLNFWATWCVPCKAELPLLDAFQRTLGKNGLVIYAVSTEDSASPRTIRKVLGPQVKITLVRPLRGSRYEIMEGLPTSYVIDRAGRLRYAKSGAFDLESLNELLIPLLKEPVPASVSVAD